MTSSAVRKANGQARKVQQDGKVFQPSSDSDKRKIAWALNETATAAPGSPDDARKSVRLDGQRTVSAPEPDNKENSPTSKGSTPANALSFFDTINREPSSLARPEFFDTLAAIPAEHNGKVVITIANSHSSAAEGLALPPNKIIIFLSDGVMLSGKAKNTKGGAPRRSADHPITQSLKEFFTAKGAHKIFSHAIAIRLCANVIKRGEAGSNKPTTLRLKMRHDARHRLIDRGLQSTFPGTPYVRCDTPITEDLSAMGTNDVLFCDVNGLNTDI